MRRRRSNSEESEENESRPMLGLPQQFGKAEVQPLAEFEKYSKGIGSKLLLKMGYQPGKGLGADGSGITAPIDVKLRPQGMGLGHGGFDERTETVKREQKQKGIVFSDEEEEQIVVQKEWKKQKKTIRRIKKTAEELLAEQDSLPVPMTGPTITKVIDMTGKQTREVDFKMERRAQLAELVYNVQTLTDLSQSDLLHHSRQMRIETMNLQREKENLTALEAHIKQETQKVLVHEKIVEVIVKIKSIKNQDLVVIQEHLNVLYQQKQEYQELQLDRLAVGLFLDRFRSLMREWNPTEIQDTGSKECLQWKHLMIVPSEHVQSTMTAYETMLYTYWLPKVRHYLTNDWNYLEPEGAVTLLESWYPLEENKRLIPLWLWQNIVYQLLLPKLKRAVEDLKPKTSISCHQWLFPWLPLLGEQLQELWTLVRRQFAIVFRNWHATDPSAMETLLPWMEVFSQDDYEQLLRKCIVPGLTRYLESEFTINPANQDIVGLTKYVFVWAVMIPEHLYGPVFEQGFFPKWHEALWMWIQSPGASLDQISQWYTSWKGLFEEAKIQNLKQVKDGFVTGLDMMNQGLSARKQDIKTKFVHSTSQVETQPVSEDLTFTEFVSLMAQEANVEFVPLRKKHDSGKPLYRLGLYTVYLDHDVLYCLIDGQFKPKSVDELLE
ncbi:GC-rich sequence DNA-binding factor-like protein-domain-containing protein [Gorgonomyces haynaldii]|nr:GC-rich sequence DNA-binding factor-like protein-domain-containing protein [Gorgonomyces haynaldii]